MLSMSTRRHEYGRTTRDEATQGGWFNQRGEGDSDNEPEHHALQFQGLSMHHSSGSDDEEDDSEDDDPDN